MTATAEPDAPTVEARAARAPAQGLLARGAGVELLGPVHGSGYKEGAALVRREDGQVVQLGPLMYGLLECADGGRDPRALADALTERVGRRVEEEHVVRLAEKLAAQGLLAGTEHNAPPRRNPLLALRWKVLITDPEVTRRLTAPLTFLFRPWLMWPILAAFVGVFWFVLVHKGVASATAQAFRNPGLLLLVFVLAVISAGFHELGHASAARYGGATPGGMGVGLYLVWPAFYTDVTDAYRLPRRDRLRVDLGGLYFNAVVAVVTMAVWLVWHVDALLLLVALQVLQMVKQLSPVIRADGYHILSDATGVPDLFSHMGPTLRRLLPGHRHEPSALTGWARFLVTAWVLIVVPVLLSLMFSAILLFPKLATSAWDTGRAIAVNMPHQASHGQILDLLASLVRLLALALPVFGSALVTQRFARTAVKKARAWSAGSPPRRAAAVMAGVGVLAALAWAWWPSGQYQPVRANQGGTLGSLIRLVSAPARVARPAAKPVAAVHLTPGTHLAIAMIPVGGASAKHPALFVIPGKHGDPPVAIVSGSGPSPGGAPTVSGTSTTSTQVTTPSGATTTTTTPAPSTGSSAPGSPVPATAFPFKLPAPPGPGGTQAEAVNTTNGGVTYDIAYALVTVSGGAPVTQTNSAFAIAHCSGCTTVAVSFQVVLVIGHSKIIDPINAAGSLNYDCPACTTTAIADQIVVTLKSQPSKELLARLEAALEQLNALPTLGAAGSPTAVAAQVAAVQQQIDAELAGSGLLTNTSPSTQPTTTSSTPSTTTSGAQTTTGQSTTSPATPSATTPTTTATTTATDTTTATTTTAAPSAPAASSGTTSATTTAP